MGDVFHIWFALPKILCGAFADLSDYLNAWLLGLFLKVSCGIVLWPYRNMFSKGKVCLCGVIVAGIRIILVLSIISIILSPV